MKQMNSKKVTTKVLALTLATSTVFGLVGCKFRTDEDESKPIDPSKTQLYIGATAEGLNESWLNSVIDEFEKAYPEYQVYVDGFSNEATDTLVEALPTQRQDIFFLQSFNIADAIKGGYVENITDVVTVGDPTIENGKTIESKIHQSFKEAYQTKETDGSITYYSIPYAMLPYGITYDADLFEDRGLYNLSQYKGLDCIAGNADDKYGPDGVEGGGDDGLPATWEDFKAMMNVMRQKGITPFIWSGEHSSYRTNFMEAIIASYEGAENFELYSTFNGVDYYTGKTITLANGYELINRPGQKAALQVAYDIVSNSKNYSNKSFFMSTSHLVAQNEFILSERSNKPIAMLLEGAWWEHEAKATFEEMEGEFGDEYGYGARNFKFMPFPKFVGTSGIEDQPNAHRTLFDMASHTVCFMNAASQHKEAAKLFLRFVHMEESLKAFTLDNGLIRPYEYSFSNAELETLTPLSRSIWEVYKSADFEIANIYYSDESIRDNSTYIGGFLLTGELGEDAYGDPLANFYANSTWTVAQYLQAKANKYSQSRWNKTII